MTSDAGAVRRAAEACRAIAEECRESAALCRLKGEHDEAALCERDAKVADRCAGEAEKQR